MLIQTHGAGYKIPVFDHFLSPALWQWAFHRYFLVTTESTFFTTALPPFTKYLIKRNGRSSKGAAARMVGILLCSFGFARRRRYPAIRGDIFVASETSNELGRNSNVARVSKGWPMEPEPLSRLLDATLAGMAPTGLLPRINRQAAIGRFC